MTSASASVSLAQACSADSFWERWCRTASSEQRQQILPAAIASGLVQIHHLPVPTLQSSRTVVQNLIASLLTNRPQTLEPALPAFVEVFDTELDDDQRYAVAVALASLDLCLIQGVPGSGKSRVVAEICRQAIRQSKRVLLVAPSGAALDRVIDRLADLAPHTLRCHGADETPRAASVSLQDRLRDYDQRTLPAARHEVEEAQRRLADSSALGDDWPRLRALPAMLDTLGARRTALEQQRLSLASVVEREWSSTPIDSRPSPWADLRRKHDEVEQELTSRLRQLADRYDPAKAETIRLAAEHKSLSAQAQARTQSRWWTLAFWQSRSQPDPAPRLAELDRLLATHHDQIAVLEQEKAGLAESLQKSRDEFAAQRAELHRVEVQRREADLDREVHEATIAIDALKSEWSAIVPGEIHPGAVEAAEQNWHAGQSALSDELANRRAWLEALEQARPGLASDFVLAARLLAVPVAEVLGLGAERTPGAFDLVLVEDAHRLAEKDLLAITRLAPRCVLVGEPTVAIPMPHSPRRNGAIRPGDVASANAYRRLWTGLHADPLRVSATWAYKGGRLVALLHAFGPEDESQITREPVFDRPEIELAIHTPTGADPRIVEVCFPASTSLGEAKGFLYRESGDLSIQSSGPGFRWRDTDECHYLHLGSSAGPIEADVALDPGVVEHLGRCDSSPADEPAWHTLGLSFARSAGWDRSKASGWLNDRLGLRDFGRTACLGRIYRAKPVLSTFLSGLLFPPHPASGRSLPLCDAIEFVPVGGEHADDWAGPSRITIRPESGTHSSGTATLESPLVRHRSGAGFEIDLADPRRQDTIAPLRSSLPPRGIVNSNEARLLVGVLESLVLDPSVRASLSDVGDDDPHLAVLSLHFAQVELLRLLVHQSAILAESGLRILVGHPSALAHRECPIVCLGLTRSHSNRAVPFSDDPRDLVLALTRATERLLVFGDPGTMTRRSQWFGALDHLTETTGPIEQALLSRILAHFPEREVPARPVRDRESSGV